MGADLANSNNATEEIVDTTLEDEISKLAPADQAFASFRNFPSSISSTPLLSSSLTYNLVEPTPQLQSLPALLNDWSIPSQKPESLPGEEVKGSSNVNSVEPYTMAMDVVPSDSGYGTASRYSRVNAKAVHHGTVLASNSDQQGVAALQDPGQNEDNTKTLYSDAASLSDLVIDRYARALADDIAQSLGARTTLTLRAMETISNVLHHKIQH